MVDVNANVQQTVMSQAILEGVPTGRDPWSVAKIIPGVQVKPTTSAEPRACSRAAARHGSRDDDKNFAIDGST